MQSISTEYYIKDINIIGDKVKFKALYIYIYILMVGGKGYAHSKQIL